MATAPRLAINATELLRVPGTVRTMVTEFPLADVDVADGRVTGAVDIDLTLTSTLDDIEVEGTVRVEWADACRRCLRPVSGPLVVAVDERYATPSDDPARPVNAAAFPIEHGQLDVSAMVREEILLAIPDAPICRDDCPGLCPTCGADLDDGPCGCDTTVRDERWTALDQLRDEIRNVGGDR